MRSISKRKLTIISVTALIVGVGLVSYVGNIWGERGLHADMYGTAGYITSMEAVLFVLGILLTIGAFLSLLLNLRK